jgi:hypothetical protein
MYCPIKTSKEYIKILNDVNGNDTRAEEEWIRQGFDLNKDLNYIPDVELADTSEVKKDDISTMVDKIWVHLEKQLKILQGQKLINQTAKEERQKKLTDEFRHLEGINSINMFVKDSYDKALEIEKLMKAIINKKDDGTDKFKKDRIVELTNLNTFANSYNILDEISKADIYSFFTAKEGEEEVSEKTGKTIREMLTDAISIRKAVKEQYIKQGIPLMASFLLNYKSLSIDDAINKELVELVKKLEAEKISAKPNDKKIKAITERIAKFQSFTQTQESMEELLKFASRDEGALEFWFGPLISNEDASLGLFAKAIKTEFEGARQLDIDIAKLAGKQFTKYKDSQSESRDTPAKFNEGLYEELISHGKNNNGEPTITKRMAFVQKYDINKYNEAQNKLYSATKLGPNPTDAEIIANSNFEANKSTILRDWYAKNAQKKSDEEIDKILLEKNKLVNNGIWNQEDYDKWHKSVLQIKKDGTKIYMKEFSEPADMYLNKKWEALYDKNDKPKNAKGEYHSFLLNLYLDAQEKVPDAQKRGYILPSIHKRSIERSSIKSVIKDKFKDMTSIRGDETDFNLSNLSDEGAKFIPVYYTQDMDADEVSLDLIRSVELYSQMANKYEAVNNISAETSMFKAIIGDREVAETNSKGVAVLDSLANKLGIKSNIKKQGEANSKRHVDAFINMQLYNEMQNAEILGNYSMGKLTNLALGYSAITSIAADLLKGMANNLQGNIQLIIEANSSEFFSRKDLRKGKLYYAKNLTSFLSDFGKPTAESLVGNLVNHYDALQGNYKDQYGKNVSGSVFAKLMRTDTLFFNQHFGEHEIQVSAMFALMEATKVTDTNTGETISLLEAYTKYGLEEIEKNTDFTNKKKLDLQDRIHAISKKLHGVYNDFDKGTAQRYSVGRLAIMYRKHLLPGYKRRWGRLKADQELGSITEGYYMTFYNTMLKDLAKMKLNMMQNWSTYTPFEKAQIKRVMAETVIIFGTTAFIMLLMHAFGDDDDEKKGYAYNFMLYELSRMQSETAAYISPQDAYRTVKSPSAMVSTVERMTKFVSQFFLTWDPEKLNYKRKEGVWNKGDNKSWAYFLKLMGFSGYNFTPEAAVKSFKATLLK